MKRRIERIRDLGALSVRGRPGRGAPAEGEPIGALQPRLGTRLRALPVIGKALALLESITPLGRGVGMVGVLGAAAGLAWRWPEALIPGAGALVLLLGSLLISLIPTPVSVHLHLPKTRVVTGEDAVGELVVKNPRRRSIRPVLVEFTIDDSTRSGWTPRIEPSGEQSDPFIITTRRRGRRRVGPARVVRGDLLGLVRRECAGSEAIDLLVLPRTVAMSFNAIGVVKDLDGLVTQDLSSADVAFRSLRDYVPGDDRRAVHWRTSARLGRLVVREFEESRRSHLLIVLDLDESAWTDEESFEDGVSVVASLARSALAQSVEVSIFSHAGVHNSASVRSALDALTEVKASGQIRSINEVVHSGVGSAPGASVLVVVTGSGRTASALHGLITDLPPTLTPLVVRCDREPPAGIRTIGGLVIVDLQALEELPALMRRAGR